MNAIAVPRFFASTIGKKVVMATTGVVLFGFVIVHMIGNLQIYVGPDKLNAYAQFLHSTPALLWTTRVVVGSAVLAHIIVAALIEIGKKRARPVGYANQRYRYAALPSRTMFWTGIVLGGFVIYHLLHFTTGQAHPEFTTDVYRNVVVGFQNPIASIAYIVAMGGLAAHLWHASFSMFQSVGLRTPSYAMGIRRVTAAIVVIVCAVNISFPLAVLSGLVQ